MRLDQIADKAATELREAGREARFTATVPGPKRGFTSGPVVALAGFLAVLVVGLPLWFLTSSDESPQTGSPGDPTQSSDVSSDLSSSTQGDVSMGEAAETEGDRPDRPPLSGESLTAADLDQALVAFVECLRPGLDGFIRVNFDRYLDFSMDYTLPDGRNDPEAASRLFDDCDQKTGFLEKDSAYRRANSLTVNQIREIASEFTVCVEDAGMDPSVFASADELDSADDLERWRNTFYREAPAAEQESLRNCAETVFYGPVLEF